MDVAILKLLIFASQFAYFGPGVSTENWTPLSMYCRGDLTSELLQFPDPGVGLGIEEGYFSSPSPLSLLL